MAKEMIIVKSIVIDKPIAETFGFLKNCANQERFSVWNMKDPTKAISYKGIDGTEGFVYSWDSKNKNVGAGSQEITKIITNERIEYALNFERPMKNTGTAKFMVEAVENNQTKVTWEFRGATKFPMSLFKGIFEKMLGKDMIESLGNLKALLEK